MRGGINYGYYYIRRTTPGNDDEQHHYYHIWRALPLRCSLFDVNDGGRHEGGAAFWRGGIQATASNTYHSPPLLLPVSDVHYLPSALTVLPLPSLFLEGSIYLACLHGTAFLGRLFHCISPPYHWDGEGGRWACSTARRGWRGDEHSNDVLPIATRRPSP